MNHGKHGRHDRHEKNGRPEIQGRPEIHGRHRSCGRAMSRSRQAIVVVALATLMASIAGCESEEAAPLGSIDYSGWRQTTSAVLNSPIPGHGDGLRRVFANDLAFSAPVASDGSIEYPDGSIFVKEVYGSASPSPSDAPMAITVMLKAPTDSRSRGGWVWIVRDPASDQETVFDEDFCVTCHATASEAHPYGTGNLGDDFRDYVFHAPALEAPPAP